MNDIKLQTYYEPEKYNPKARHVHYNEIKKLHDKRIRSRSQNALKTPIIDKKAINYMQHVSDVNLKFNSLRNIVFGRCTTSFLYGIGKETAIDLIRCCNVKTIDDLAFKNFNIEALGYSPTKTASLKSLIELLKNA